MLGGGDRSGLTVGLGDELWSLDIGHPNLNGPEALFAKSLAMRAYPIPCSCRAITLHVTSLGDM